MAMKELSTIMTELPKSTDPNAGTLLQKVGNEIKELDGNSVAKASDVITESLIVDGSKFEETLLSDGLFAGERLANGGLNPAANRVSTIIYDSKIGDRIKFEFSQEVSIAAEIRIGATPDSLVTMLRWYANPGVLPSENLGLEFVASERCFTITFGIVGGNLTVNAMRTLIQDGKVKVTRNGYDILTRLEFVESHINDFNQKVIRDGFYYGERKADGTRLSVANRWCTEIYEGKIGDVLNLKLPSTPKLACIVRMGDSATNMPIAHSYYSADRIASTWFEYGTQCRLAGKFFCLTYAIYEGSLTKETLTDLFVRGEASVDKIDDSISRIVNNETENKLLQLARVAHQKQTAKGTPLTLLHFSDVHSSKINVDRIVSFSRAYRKYINDVIFTGDMVTTKFSDSIEFWGNGAEYFLSIIGNHEGSVNGGTPWNGTPIENVNAKFIAPFISNWGVSNSSGKNYWYKDYATQKIRLIGLDAIYYDDEENSWLQSTLASAKVAGLAVIIASHYKGGALTPISCTFDDSTLLTEVAETSAMTDQRAAALVDSFITNGGEFICWICGHQHCDLVGYLTQHTNQLCICIDTANGNKSDRTLSAQSGYGLVERIIGVNEDCFNCISFDKFDHIVKLARIGANVDQFMRGKNMLCIDYKHMQVVSNS